jgi:Lar family restriction alleviation protein
MTENLPCPYCGHDKQTLDMFYGDGPEGAAPFYGVCCSKCHASSPHHHDLDTAIKYWNTQRPITV